MSLLSMGVNPSEQSVGEDDVLASHSDGALTNLCTGQVTRTKQQVDQKLKAR